MAQIKSKTTEYIFSLDDIKSLMAKDLNIPVDAVTLDPRLHDIADWQDTHPHYRLKDIVVIVNEIKLKKLWVT